MSELSTIDDVRRDWDAWGELDPLWAILSDPAKRGNRWDIDEFFDLGRVEVAAAVADARSLWPQLELGRAMDFGCGVGRLTQALCDSFREADGVDISKSMISLARRLNRHGDSCRYHLNEKAHLGLFGDETFDFVYSRIVLQHMEPHLSKPYIAEFMRVLRPGGVTLFQLPSERRPLEERGLPTGDTRRQQQPKRLQGRALLEAQPSATMLQAAALKAAVVLDAPPQGLELAPGERAPLLVTVTNASSRTWPIDGVAEISLRNLWRGEDGSARGDGKTLLPRTLRKGASATVVMTVSAPAQPGRYLLDIGIVQSGAAWFQLADPEAAQAQVRVTNRRKRPDTSEKPRIRMWGIPRDEVVAIVEQRGGRVLEIVDDAGAARDWVSWRYVVAKDG